MHLKYNYRPRRPGNHTAIIALHSLTRLRLQPGAQPPAHTAPPAAGRPRSAPTCPRAAPSLPRPFPPPPFCAALCPPGAGGLAGCGGGALPQSP